jgi:hypothetical protein
VRKDWQQKKKQCVDAGLFFKEKNKQINATASLITNTNLASWIDWQCDQIWRFFLLLGDCLL